MCPASSLSMTTKIQCRCCVAYLYTRLEWWQVCVGQVLWVDIDVVRVPGGIQAQSSQTTLQPAHTFSVRHIAMEWQVLLR